MKEFPLDIIKAEKCPYCGGKPEYKDSGCVYKKSYGMIYICQPCQAWVGVHKGTDRPLGRLADKELRDAKILAHFYFDALWKHGVSNGRKKGEVRKAAYKWLSNELGIIPIHTHIGMFDLETCKKASELCKKYYLKIQ